MGLSQRLKNMVYALFFSFFEAVPFLINSFIEMLCKNNIQFI